MREVWAASNEDAALSIAIHLPFSDLAALAGTCNTWHRMCSTEMLWQAQLEKLLKEHKVAELPEVGGMGARAYFRKCYEAIEDATLVAPHVRVAAFKHEPPLFSDLRKLAGHSRP